MAEDAGAIEEPELSGSRPWCVRLGDEGAFFTGRDRAKRILSRIESVLPPAVIDFTGVIHTSTEFLTQYLEDLVERSRQHGYDLPELRNVPDAIAQQIRSIAEHSKDLDLKDLSAKVFGSEENPD